MLVDKKIIVTPEEALDEIINIFKKHRLRPILSDAAALDETIDRFRAVIEFYEATKPKKGKK